MRRGTAAAVTVGIIVAALAGAAPAAAVDDDGLWYYDMFGMAATHASGITGKGVTIAVLDTSINPAAPALAGADLQVQASECYEGGERVPSTSTGPEAVHGTQVVSLIVGNGSDIKGIAPDARVLYYPVSGEQKANGFSSCDGPSGEGDYTSTGEAMLSAVEAGADIISVSAGMLGTVELISAIATAQHEGVVIVGAVANGSETVTGFQPNMPAAANGVVGVQAIDSSVAVASTDGEPNADTMTDVVAPGVRVLTQGSESGGVVDWSAQNLSSGTSYATPIVAGMLALVKQKYPDATGNQLIQTLVRNTNADDHELSFDGSYLYGFGVASATHMLEFDPTQYDDVNLLLAEGDFIPTQEMVANPEALQDWVDAAFGTSADPGADKPGEKPDQPSPPAIPMALILVAVGIVLLLVVGAVILIIVLAARRSREPTPHDGAGR